MIWGLFQAGASNVVAASWHVDVRSAAELLASFYRELLRQKSPAMALRAASLAIRQVNDTWRHFYHYAAFNAFGYWN
jgi:CHAT domain-containing protein